MLILNDIDSDSKKIKTVSFSDAVKRLVKSGVYQAESESIQFLTDCAELRNEFIHFKVHIRTPEIKRKYTKLVMCYLALHQEIICNPIPHERKYERILERISNFNKCIVIFRGKEYSRTEVENAKKELIKAQEYCYYSNNESEKIHRIQYGLENGILDKKGRYSLTSNKPTTNLDILVRNYHIMTFDSDYEYCTKCRAHKGEYHVQGCDNEICPVCNNFIVACKCELTLCK